MTTRRAGALLVALGGMVAVVTLMVAGPAHAQTSGGATATGGSVASGTANATNNSTASGDTEASNNSTASGCATAANTSTASGASTATGGSTASGDGRCPPAGGGGGATTTTRPGGGTTPTAGATTARLAVTGPTTAPLLAVAALAIALGTLLQVTAADRRRNAIKA